jgi:hypothetical protein
MASLMPSHIVKGRAGRWATRFDAGMLALAL